MVEVDVSHSRGKNHAVCNGLLSALSQRETEARLASLDGWESRESQLHRTFRCQDFADSFRLATLIAQISEELNHHPDFCVTNKRQVSVTIWTRQMHCVTTLDFELAESITEAYDLRSTAVTS